MSAISSRDSEAEILFQTANDALLHRLPVEQWNWVMASQYCDIDESFLGFVDVYAQLATIIPPHFTVVDLGCAYAPQAFLFDNHKSYIGVDAMTERRFSAANTTHFHTTIAEFIGTHGHSLDLDETFAICSYVPPWHGGSRDLVREFFTNLFVFYPSHKDELRSFAQGIVTRMGGAAQAAPGVERVEPDPIGDAPNFSVRARGNTTDIG